MEIERKFLLKKVPKNLNHYPFHLIEQAYLCTNPVIRIRKEDDLYYMTIKGSGLMAHDEHNFSITQEAYEHLLKKADGNIISKKRYLIPLPAEEINSSCLSLLAGTELTIELDAFAPPFSPLLLAEIEFPTIESANAFKMLPWFSEDVTANSQYHNSTMSSQVF